MPTLLRKKIKTGRFVALQNIKTPLGRVNIAAVEEGVCLVEFCDRHLPEQKYPQIQSKYGLPIVHTSSDLLELLKDELQDYFKGHLKKFGVPLAMQGTEFQERVWTELLSIPYGQTVSYRDIAERIENVKAVRAVARACADNSIGVLIPCHRVIGKDGGLTGYGGGLWRKRCLIELERTGAFPPYYYL